MFSGIVSFITNNVNELLALFSMLVAIVVGYFTSKIPPKWFRILLFVFATAFVMIVIKHVNTRGLTENERQSQIENTHISSNDSSTNMPLSEDVFIAGQGETNNQAESDNKLNKLYEYTTEIETFHFGDTLPITLYTDKEKRLPRVTSEGGVSFCSSEIAPNGDSINNAIYLIGNKEENGKIVFYTYEKFKKLKFDYYASKALNIKEKNNIRITCECPSTFQEPIYIIPDIPLTNSFGIDYSVDISDAKSVTIEFERTIYSDPNDYSGVYLQNITFFSE